MTAPVPLSILLVEDEASYSDAIRESLANIDGELHVEPCEDLACALRLLMTQAFDAALVDLGLPDAMGVEAIRAIHSAKPDLPIVVLTAHPKDDPLGEQAINAGAQDYLSKSEATPQILRRVLRYAIGRKAAAAQERARQEALRKILVDLQSSIRHFKDTARKLEKWSLSDVSQPMPPPPPQGGD